MPRLSRKRTVAGVALILVIAFTAGKLAGWNYCVIALFSGLFPLFRLFEPENPKDG